MPDLIPDKIPTGSRFSSEKAPAESRDFLPVRADTDGALIDLWLHGKAPATQDAYRTDVEPLLAACPLERLTLDRLQEWIDSLADYARATRARKIAAAKSLLRFAHRTGYIRFNVGAAVNLPKVRNRLAGRILSEATIQRIIHRAERPRDYALLLTLYATGARVSELAALRWEDVIERQKGGGQLNLFGKGDSSRSVRVSASVFAALISLRKDAENLDRGSPQDAVFVGKRGALTRKGIHDIVKRNAEKAGIKAPVSAHWFRHAAASHSLDRGAPVHLVQATLGHASLTTTSRYVHARPTDALATYLPV